jgi:hypothetical protein
MFSPLRSASALYIPPSASRIMLRFAGAWEGLGERWGLPFAGVVLVEASKQVYAANPERAARRARRRLRPGLTGSAIPSPPGAHGRLSG